MTPQHENIQLLVNCALAACEQIDQPTANSKNPFYPKVNKAIEMLRALKNPTNLAMRENTDLSDEGLNKFVAQQVHEALAYACYSAVLTNHPEALNQVKTAALVYLNAANDSDIGDNRKDELESELVSKLDRFVKTNNDYYHQLIKTDVIISTLTQHLQKYCDDKNAFSHEEAAAPPMFSMTVMVRNFVGQNRGAKVAAAQELIQKLSDIYKSLTLNADPVTVNEMSEDPRATIENARTIPDLLSAFARSNPMTHSELPGELNALHRNLVNPPAPEKRATAKIQ